METKHWPPLLGGEPRDSQTPHEALLNAILERALLDLRMFAGRKSAVARAEVRRTLDWIESDDCGATLGGFSFVFVCEHLKLAPDEIRSRVVSLVSAARVDAPVTAVVEARCA